MRTCVGVVGASMQGVQAMWSRVVCGEVRYATVRLGLVSSDRQHQQLDDKPTISHLIKSCLPTVVVIKHYFALPSARYRRPRDHAQVGLPRDVTRSTTLVRFVCETDSSCDV